MHVLSVNQKSTSSSEKDQQDKPAVASDDKEDADQPHRGREQGAAQLDED